MIKPRTSIRTDLPFKVSGRSRPSGGWEGRNGLQKNCFQFGLQIRGGVGGGGGGAGSATESNRIVMNGGSFIPTETTRAWESCLFFEGDARWVHPSSQANFWHLI